MINQHWILLKSADFHFSNATIGAPLADQDLLSMQFIDYQVSDNTLKGLASLFVINHGQCQLKPHWSTKLAQQRQLYLLHNEVGTEVGVIIAISQIAQSPPLFQRGHKLSQQLGIANDNPPQQDQRTRAIVNLTALGLSTQEISALISLSCRGVEYHLDKAKQQLGANNKANLVFKAAKAGWL